MRTLARVTSERSLPRSCANADGRPKRAFAHLGDAQLVADASDERLMPYHCRNCEMWHLATRPGHVGTTVTSNCPRCGKEFSWTDRGKRGHAGLALDDPGFCEECWDTAGA